MDLTLEQKIGQMLCFGWSGTTDEENLSYSAHARELIEEMQVGGVILMGRNVAPPYLQTAETLNEMQRASNIPLFVAVDQEGGMVARFGEPMTVFPSNMAIGATRSIDYARRSATAAGEELAAVGVNWNFAPSVDVNNNPLNPIIGIRSFGESPDIVSELGSAAIEGYQSAGIIACAKHFPGHGDTSVDSHLALPSIPYGRDRLDKVELPPFAAAISAGVDSIMTTHIMFPALDDQLPATLSKAIITGLLKREMGFNGIVVTDCMEMKAIADNYGTGEAAVLAIEAGVDVLLACHTLSIQRMIREAVIKAVKDGRISENRINQSVERILAMKQKHRLNEKRSVDVSKVPERLGTPEHRALQQEIAERSITIIRNNENFVPLQMCEKCNLVVAGLHKSVVPLAEAIKTYHSNTTVIKVTKETLDEAVKTASQAVAAIIVTSPNEPWQKPIDQSTQTELVKRVNASGTPTIVIAVREPYDLMSFPEIGTFIATYGYGQPSLDAVAKVLFGAT